MNLNTISQWITLRTTKELLRNLVGNDALDYQEKRILALSHQFALHFPLHDEIEFFSASGRLELIGNHTDHQGGHVLACAINLDTLACAYPNHEQTIRLHSLGYESVTLDCRNLLFNKNETNTTLGLLKGLAYYFSHHATLRGVDIVMESDIKAGSGLSSSASFECLILTIFNTFFSQNNPLSPLEIAQMGQKAENHYFGKPCGLMDQLTIMTGGICVMDFSHSKPEIKKLTYAPLFDDYHLCVVHTGESHDDLTYAYAQIVSDHLEISSHFNATKLSMVSFADFLNELPILYHTFPTRLLLRVFHYFSENQRVLDCVRTLEHNHHTEFLKHMINSSHSSFEYLDNVNHPISQKQGLALAIALAQQILAHDGAYRIHGEGFAGTILCLCPHQTLETLKKAMQAVFGPDCFKVVKVWQSGVVHLK